MTFSTYIFTPMKSSTQGMTPEPTIYPKQVIIFLMNLIFPSFSCFTTSMRRELQDVYVADIPIIMPTNIRLNAVIGVDWPKTLRITREIPVIRVPMMIYRRRLPIVLCPLRSLSLDQSGHAMMYTMDAITQTMPMPSPMWFLYRLIREITGVMNIERALCATPPEK